MEQKQESISDLAPEIRMVLRENRRLKSEIKGYKGRLAVLDKKQEETQAAQAPDKSKEAENKPAEAPPKHYTRKWERTCIDCGGKNEGYVKPNAFCATCNYPLGAYKDKEEAAAKVTKECPTCGGLKAYFGEQKHLA